MATSLTTRIALTVTASMTDTSIVLPDGTSPIIPLNLSKVWNWASGTGIDQADRIFMKRDTVSNGAPDTFDLAGSLTDNLGNVITMARVNAILLFNNSTTPAEIMSLGGGSNPLLNWIIATGDGTKAGPQGASVHIDPSLAGYAVTAGTGDVLQVAVASGTNVSYDLIVIGRSA